MTLNEDKYHQLDQAIEHAQSLFFGVLSHRSSCKSYELLSLLRDESVYPWAESPMLALFQKQFVIHAGLLRLEAQFKQEERGQLVMDAVNITLISSSDSGDDQGQSLTSDSHHYMETVKSFYLDSSHFFSATEESVDCLLNEFWKRFNASEGQQAALSVLGLQAPTDLPQIKRAYRQMANLHHPDRGGDSVEFDRCTQAYETLKALYQ